MDGDSYDVVLVVHGTFANPDRGVFGSKRPSQWWESFGSFTNALDAALARRGAVARHHVPARFRPYGLEQKPHASWRGWSGDNSEVERRRGAYDLAAHIRYLQNDSRVSRIHIVAHSHGGNVARRALRYLKDPRHKLGAVVYLGTPFLHFRDTAKWRRWLAAVHWPMLFVFLVIVAIAAFFTARAGLENQFVAMLFLGIGVAALSAMWEYARTSEGNEVEVPAVALRFAGDEAIRLLVSCRNLVAKPHIYLRGWLGGTPRPHRLARRDAGLVVNTWRALVNGCRIVSNVWNGPLCRVAERVTTVAYRVPLLGDLCALSLIATMRPYRPPLQPFLLARTPRLASLFFQPMHDEVERRSAADFSASRVRQFRGLRELEPEPPRTRSTDGTIFDPRFSSDSAAAVAGLLYAVFYPIDHLLGVPSWCGAVMTRFAILTGARAAAASAPGMDMLGSAFRASHTGREPAGVARVTVPRTIRDDLERRLDASARLNLSALRAGLNPARRASMLATIRTAFTDVGLLHAQYYQDTRIIDYIAQCIAGTEPREWVLDETR
jgi:hypothetical protein